ncbi:hypothetical protein [Yersinia proxima]|uniref:hypothetical protein n=1 Tax=Yersinia proxima TaxID=2890316 RepID=UPI0029B1F302|nr:hypothetical protein [Yersinia enterocolitica]HEI6823285.1 hypothetical protein [Yersinia enterocolitica]HEI6882415.1 hypothetical protein [Yersinia enterocolitica]
MEWFSCFFSNTTAQQYSTWVLVLFGWVVSIIVARYVLRKNAKNTWIGDIKKTITSLEDGAITFWMGKNSTSEAIELSKLGRDVKDITTLAREIQSYGGCKYDNTLFISLRRVVTEDISKNGVLCRELTHNDFRIQEISRVCASLKSKYVRN